MAECFGEIITVKYLWDIVSGNKYTKDDSDSIFAQQFTLSLYTCCLSSSLLTHSHDYKSAFGVEVNLGLCKADRLVYGESLMTHAMTFTAVTLNVSSSSFFPYIKNYYFKLFYESFMAF